MNAVAIHFPFAGREETVYYHLSPVEKYFPVAPGIEVSAEPYAGSWKEDSRLEASIYDGRGKLCSPARKGDLLDTRL